MVVVRTPVLASLLLLAVLAGCVQVSPEAPAALPVAPSHAAPAKAIDPVLMLHGANTGVAQSDVVPVPTHSAAATASAAPKVRAPSIQDAHASDVSSSAATVSWTVRGPGPMRSWVEYGRDATHFDQLSGTQTGSGPHEVGLDHLEGNYWLRVVAENAGGHVATEAFGLSTTQSGTTPRGETEDGPAAAPDNTTATAPPDPGVFEIAGNTPAMFDGDTRQLILKAIPPTVGPAPKATWISHDQAILKIASPDGLVKAIAPGVAHVEARYPGGTAFATVRVCSGGRNFVDQSDEQDGYQVHLFYVIPSDGADRHFDTTGAIIRSSANWEAWFKEQTGSTLRLDTCGDRPEVTFFQLSNTDDYYSVWGLGTVSLINNELHAAGFTDPHKLYAAYYDGTHTSFAGAGGRQTAAAFLKCKNCDASNLGGTTSTPATTLGGFDMVMMHELIHSLGFLQMCSPNANGMSHATDDPSDVMYQGSKPRIDPYELDGAHDDYYQAFIPGCRDLSRSALLEPLPTDELEIPPSLS